MVFQKVVQEQIPTHEFKLEGDSVVGYVVNIKGDLGVKKSTLYILSDIDGENKVGIWGTAKLNDLMSQIKKGDLVKITYLGKIKGKKGFSYLDFLVEKDVMAIEDKSPSMENGVEEQPIEEKVE